MSTPYTLLCTPIYYFLIALNDLSIALIDFLLAFNPISAITYSMNSSNLVARTRGRPKGIATAGVFKRVPLEIRDKAKALLDDLCLGFKGIKGADRDLGPAEPQKALKAKESHVDATCQRCIELEASLKQERIEKAQLLESYEKVDFEFTHSKFAHEDCEERIAAALSMDESQKVRWALNELNKLKTNLKAARGEFDQGG